MDFVESFNGCGWFWAIRALKKMLRCDAELGLGKSKSRDKKRFETT
jgi:hypothetical protein